MTLKEAKERAKGEEWWKADLHGKKVPVRQYAEGAPRDKPIWLFENDDMYLGEWKNGKKNPVEEGFGVTYNDDPPKFKGKVYVGGWKGGFCHGLGKSFWLESSSTWCKNYLPGSEIRQNIDGKRVPVPYQYVGQYKQSLKDDPKATVTLKDGTTRVGRWSANKVVGGWWTDHQSAETGSTSRGRKTGSSRAAAAAKTATSRRRKKQKQSENVGSSTTSNEQDETKQHVDNLTEWLASDVIGRNPIMSQMTDYAEELVGKGFHSSEMVADFCSQDEVSSWHWMLDVHKRAFNEWLQENGNQK